MSEFEEKLNAILGNPEAMAQVAQLARSLSGTSGERASDPSASQPSGEAEAPAYRKPSQDIPDLGSLAGQLDPDSIKRFLPLLTELGSSNENDPRMALLQALAPFLRPERREKVERAARTAHLLHIGKKFFSTLGGGHV